MFIRFSAKLKRRLVHIICVWLCFFKGLTRTHRFFWPSWGSRKGGERNNKIQLCLCFNLILYTSASKRLAGRFKECQRPTVSESKSDVSHILTHIPPTEMSVEMELQPGMTA